MVQHVQANQGLLTLITLITIIVVIINVVTATSKRLPTIWQDDQSEIKYYHLLSELELHNSGQSFILEEWVSRGKQTFRLDSIESQDGIRNTLLAYKSTNEYYHLKPFTCSLVESLNNTLNPRLADKFPNLETFIPTGIGALWLHSVLLEADYTNYGRKALKNNDDITQSYYSKYTIPSTESFPFRIEFYFATTEAKFAQQQQQQQQLNTSNHLQNENLKTLSAIKLLHPTEEQVVMRLRLLEQETSAIISPQSYDKTVDVFDLPEGYGCERATTVKQQQQLESSLYPPSDISISSNVGGNVKEQQLKVPQQPPPYFMQLDMVTLQPISMATDREKWRTHSTSTKLTTGRLAATNGISKNYLVSETQDYAVEANSHNYLGSQVKRATLRRIKRIWDLGEDRGDGSDYKGATGQLYYELDEQTGKCLGVGGQNEYLTGDNKSEQFDFDVSREQSSSVEEAAIGAQESPVTTADLTLNSQIIRELFSSEDGYHLIREKSLSNNKESIYERRISNFQIHNRQGRIRWSGPVSVVRRSRFVETGAKLGRKRKKFATVTIYFLSVKLDRIVSQLQLEVAEQRPVDLAYYHRELDVSQCFNALLTSQRNGNDRRKSEQQFYVTYPVDVDTAEQLAESDQFEALIYEKFLNSLLTSSEGRLDLLQVVDLRVDFQPTSVLVSGKLIEKPTILSYTKSSGQKFSKKSQQKSSIQDRLPLYLTEFKANEEACAQSCHLYKCLMFVYCQSGKICDLMLTESSGAAAAANNYDQTQLATFEVDPTCNLYRLRSSEHQQQQPPLRPLELVERLQHRMATSTRDTLLSFRLNNLTEGSQNGLIFIPESFESSASSLISSSTAFATQSKAKQRQLFNEPPDYLLKAEYALTLIDRKYKVAAERSEQFPVEEAKHLSYEQCEQLCDQVDCNSFSYCSLDVTASCYVSRLHRSSDIEEHSERQEFCVVMARDYMSKFQEQQSNSVQVLADDVSIAAEADNNNNQVVLMRALQVFSSPLVTSSRDCAISCIEEAHLKCKSFYFCNINGDNRKSGNAGCYLRTSHSAQELSNNNNNNNNDDNYNLSNRQMNSKNKTAKTFTCDFYSRSYLADFDRYNWRKLPVGSERYSVSFSNLSAEGCALECASKRHRFCRAFQMCRSSSGEALCVVQSITTATATSSVSEQQQSLPVDENCTTFLLRSPEVVSSTSGTWLAAQQVAISLTDSSTEWQSSDGNWWWSLILQYKVVLLLLFGLILGYFTGNFIAIKQQRTR